MKKLLIILLFLPVIGFSQLVQQYQIEPLDTLGVGATPQNTHIIKANWDEYINNVVDYSTPTLNQVSLSGDSTAVLIKVGGVNSYGNIFIEQNGEIASLAELRIGDTIQTSSSSTSFTMQNDSLVVQFFQATNDSNLFDMWWNPVNNSEYFSIIDSGSDLTDVFILNIDSALFTGTVTGDTANVDVDFQQWGLIKAYSDSVVAGKQDSITLTTTGTSGAATFSNDTLNIPNYDSGSGVSFGLENQIPVTNSTTDDFDYSTGLSYTGSIFTVTGAAKISNGMYSDAIFSLTDNVQVAVPDQYGMIFSRSIRFAGQSGDISPSVSGDVWYNSTSQKFRLKENNNILDITNASGFEESSDPSALTSGYVIWQSDGTGSGDDGDIMIKINDGSTTKTITLVDYSAH